MKGDTVIQSDVEVLTALNRDYIQSVQDGDVQRFEEILADDFRTPTGHWSTRTTSSRRPRPVTITGLEAQDVRVRILGDVANIHARTSYTTADGTQRYGRYTDVWARRNGKWLAVSAHVTR